VCFVFGRHLFSCRLEHLRELRCRHIPVVKWIWLLYGMFFRFLLHDEWPIDSDRGMFSRQIFTGVSIGLFLVRIRSIHKLIIEFDLFRLFRRLLPIPHWHKLLQRMFRWLLLCDRGALGRVWRMQRRSIRGCIGDIMLFLCSWSLSA